MSTNVPITAWQPYNGDGEFSNTTASYIVDTAGNLLVDTAGNNIVDTGVVLTPKPATAWSENDGQ